MTYDLSSSILLVTLDKSERSRDESARSIAQALIIRSQHFYSFFRSFGRDRADYTGVPRRVGASFCAGITP